MKNDDILVSVIIPAYNAEKYLGFCLDTVIAQTHKKLEIIVINDGSKDNTGKICDEYAEKDSRIRVIHQELLSQGTLDLTKLPENISPSLTVTIM